MTQVFCCEGCEREVSYDEPHFTSIERVRGKIIRLCLKCWEKR